MAALVSVRVGAAGETLLAASPLSGLDAGRGQWEGALDLAAVEAVGEVDVAPADAQVAGRVAAAVGPREVHAAHVHAVRQHAGDPQAAAPLARLDYRDHRAPPAPGTPCCTPRTCGVPRRQRPLTAPRL